MNRAALAFFRQLKLSSAKCLHIQIGKALLELDTCDLTVKGVLFLLGPVIQIRINLQTNNLNECCRIRIIRVLAVWIRKLLAKRDVLSLLVALFKSGQIADWVKMTRSGKKFQSDLLSLCHKSWHYLYI